MTEYEFYDFARETVEHVNANTKQLKAIKKTLKAISRNEKLVVITIGALTYLYFDTDRRLKKLELEKKERETSHEEDDK